MIDATALVVAIGTNGGRSKVGGVFDIVDQEATMDADLDRRRDDRL